MQNIRWRIVSAVSIFFGGVGVLFLEWGLTFWQSQLPRELNQIFIIDELTAASHPISRSKGSPYQQCELHWKPAFKFTNLLDRGVILNSVSVIFEDVVLQNTKLSGEAIGIEYLSSDGADTVPDAIDNSLSFYAFFAPHTSQVVRFNFDMCLQLMDGGLVAVTDELVEYVLDETGRSSFLAALFSTDFGLLRIPYRLDFSIDNKSRFTQRNDPILLSGLPIRIPTPD